MKLGVKIKNPTLRCLAGLGIIVATFITTIVFYKVAGILFILAFIGTAMLGCYGLARDIGNDLFS